MIFTREGKELWSPFNKISFRFIFAYCSIYMFSVFAPAIWSPIIQWIGNDLIKLKYSFSSVGNGSGDTTYQYILVLFILSISLLIALIWSILDRKRPSYNALFYWLRLGIRVFLIFFMLSYGFAKIFKSQFPYPHLTRLLQPVGNMSPMGLAWTFMGYSNLYNIFTGLAEVIGGLLLISKRTKTLGAFITIGVMLNVFVMNLSYDIPVKLFSLHFIVFASIIFLTDIKRFIYIFIKNKTATKVNHYKPFHLDKGDKKIVNGIKAFFLIAFIGLFTFFSSRRSSQKEKPPLYGIWEVALFKKNNDTLLPLTTNHERWRYLIIDFRRRVTVKAMDDTNKRYEFSIDTITRQIRMHEKEVELLDGFNFKYKKPNPYFLQLDGKIEDDSLHILFSKKDLNDFRLNNRGFNWINEYPYNR